MDEVNHNMLGPKMPGKLVFARGFVAEDHDFSGAQHAFKIGRKYGSDMRDHLFYVLPVGTGEAAERRLRPKL